MRADGPVVIALDGSTHSRRTLDWGVDEAVRRGAPVVLVRTYQDPAPAGRPWGDPAHDTGARDDAERYLAAEEHATRWRWPGVALSARLVHGPAVPSLRDASEEASLLVVGAGGRGDRRELGSVAAHLAAHARCPVAVVRPVTHVPAEDDDGFEGPPARPVVVGVDGSAESSRAASVAAAAAASRGVPLDVLHAAPDLGVDGDVPPPGGDPARRGLAQVVHALLAQQPDLTVRPAVVQDDPAHALVDAARLAQLLVVGARGTGAFPGMHLGAVASQVVRTAACTVLVVHGQADAGDPLVVSRA